MIVEQQKSVTKLILGPWIGAAQVPVVPPIGLAPKPNPPTGPPVLSAADTTMKSSNTRRQADSVVSHLEGLSGSRFAPLMTSEQGPSPKPMEEEVGIGLISSPWAKMKRKRSHQNLRLNVKLSSSIKA